MDSLKHSPASIHLTIVVCNSEGFVVKLSAASPPLQYIFISPRNQIRRHLFMQLPNGRTEFFRMVNCPGCLIPVVGVELKFLKKNPIYRLNVLINRYLCFLSFLFLLLILITKSIGLNAKFKQLLRQYIIQIFNIIII